MKWLSNTCPSGTCSSGTSLLPGRGLAIAVFLLAVGAVGCQPGVASKLQGRWEGRPDTSAARGKREAEKFGKATAELADEAANGVAGGPAKGMAGEPASRVASRVTSRVTSRGPVGEVSRGGVAADQRSTGRSADGDGSASRESEGTVIGPAPVTDWEDYDVTIVMDFLSSERLELSLGDGEQPLSGRWQVVTTSPAGCAIEVQTDTEGSSEEPATFVRRRFDLLLDERDGTCVGFLLTEAGADRQQGAIYFRRPSSASVVQPN